VRSGTPKSSEKIRAETAAAFLRIGVHDSNVGGYTSKAWTISRVGSTAFLKWGAVEVRRAGRGRRIVWTHRPLQKTLRFKSQDHAIEYVRKAISRRVHHRYEKLSKSMQIGLRPVRPRVVPVRVFATVLFVDIVRSTENAARIGDHRWNEVVTHYYAALRRQLRVHRGREINTTGDGMLVTFEGRPGALRAIRCAAAMRRAVRTLGLEIRAGLHAGECGLVEDSLAGIALHIGARVMAKAGANEVLLSNNVKDLVVDAAIKFEDRGLHKLRGMTEKWRLHALA
jgi:class 3 adenylate cyclase